MNLLLAFGLDMGPAYSAFMTDFEPYFEGSLLGIRLHSSWSEEALLPISLWFPISLS